MKNYWNQAEADRCTTELELRVYSSRLLGREPQLVLHGGGNTSVKLTEPDLFGEEREILYVKGSGWDLASIEAEGFTPVDLHYLRRLAVLERLSDTQMVNELKTHQVRAAAPAASVEAILHAVLPYRYVDHTHADAVVTVTNTDTGLARVREIYGDDLVVIPYVMPGFDLARAVADIFPRQAHAGTQGMLLMNHGLFSFGDSAEQSYRRTIDLVTRAEQYLQQQGAWDVPVGSQRKRKPDARELAGLRRRISEVAGRPMVMVLDRSAATLDFCNREDLRQISQQGPATPDHVIRTKRLPMLADDLDRYVRDYRDYFAKYSGSRGAADLQPLDPAPRVVLWPELGMLTLGDSARDAGICADIYRHTLLAIQRAESLGGWRALSAQDLFAMEYWELEQAKLRLGGPAKVFAGEIALVTGAASGIGKACVDAFLARGAAVVGLDIDGGVEQREQAGFLGLRCDVSVPEQLARALDHGVSRFGGLDMLVLNAGLFPGGTRIEALSDDQWRKVMAVNLDANLTLMRLAQPLLREAPRHGRVLVIGSKNVAAPGPGAAAYSASKAALTQLARVAALEWAGDRVRVNTLHPDAVFDTGIWSDEVLEQRAAHYGLTVDAYKRKNLLGCEILSADVAELAAEFCGPRFAAVTGAQLPVDGGNERVI